MPSRNINPAERAAILDFLQRWHKAVVRIEDATDRMKTIAADKALGIRSPEYEKARVIAMAIVHGVGTESAEAGYWPQPGGRKGPALVKMLAGKLGNALQCQIEILHRWGLVAEAFRGGRENEAPPIEELFSLTARYAGLLDVMGAIATELALFYKIPASELETGTPAPPGQGAGPVA
jgi:hypothetical protein